MRLAAMQIECNNLARGCACECTSLSVHLGEDPAIVQGERVLEIEGRDGRGDRGALV
jgi:hypothetical protein